MGGQRILPLTYTFTLSMTSVNQQYLPAWGMNKYRVVHTIIKAFMYTCIIHLCNCWFKNVWVLSIYILKCIYFTSVIGGRILEYDSWIIAFIVTIEHHQVHANIWIWKVKIKSHLYCIGITYNAFAILMDVCKVIIVQ